MFKREVEIGSFIVKTDSGKEYTMVEYAEIAGPKRFVTSTGLSANRIDAETFELVQTGEVIRKIQALSDD